MLILLVFASTAPDAGPFFYGVLMVSPEMRYTTSYDSFSTGWGPQKKAKLVCNYINNSV